MEDITFKNIKELYNRLLPALNSKRKLIHKEGFKNVQLIDIWDYMYKEVWSKETGLTLYDMVSTIMHEDAKVIDDYRNKKIIDKK